MSNYPNENLWDSSGQVPTSPPPPQQFAGQAQQFGPPPTTAPAPGAAPFDQPSPFGGGFSDPDDGSTAGMGAMDGQLPSFGELTGQDEDAGGGKLDGLKAFIGTKKGKFVVIGAVVVLVGGIAVAKMAGASQPPTIPDIAAPVEVTEEDFGDLSNEGVVDETATDGALVEDPGATGEEIVVEEDDLEAARLEAEAALAEAQASEPAVSTDDVDTYAPEDNHGVVVEDLDTPTDDTANTGVVVEDTTSPDPAPPAVDTSTSGSTTPVESAPAGRVDVSLGIMCRTPATVYLTAVGAGSVDLQVDGVLYSGQGEATTTVVVEAGQSISTLASADDNVQIKWRARGRCS